MSEDETDKAFKGLVEEVMLQHSHMDGGWLGDDDVLEYDKERWPDFAKARGQVVEVGEGDQVFIPAMYWHWVFSDDDCVAVQVFHNVVEAEGGVPRAASAPTAAVPTSIEEARATSSPFVIPQGAAHWPAMKWDIPTVLTFPGLPRYVHSTGRSLCPIEKPHPYYADTGHSTTDIRSLPSLAASSHQTGVTYQWALPLTPAAAGPLADIRIPPAINPRTISNINVWCNTRKCHTGLHYDLQDNILTCLKGRKRMLLFPQSESRHLYHLPFKRGAVKAWRDAA